MTPEQQAALELWMSTYGHGAADAVGAVCDWLLKQDSRSLEALYVEHERAREDIVDLLTGLGHVDLLRELQELVDAERRAEADDARMLEWGIDALKERDLNGNEGKDV